MSSSIVLWLHFSTVNSSFELLASPLNHLRPPLHLCLHCFQYLRIASNLCIIYILRIGSNHFIKTIWWFFRSCEFTIQRAMKWAFTSLGLIRMALWLTILLCNTIFQLICNLLLWYLWTNGRTNDHFIRSILKIIPWNKSTVV